MSVQRRLGKYGDEEEAEEKVRSITEWFGEEDKGQK